MSVTVGAGRVVDLEERRMVYNLTFDAAARRLREPERLRAIAMRRLAVEALRSACHCYDRRTTGDEPVDELVDFAQATYPQWPDSGSGERYRCAVGWEPRCPGRSHHSRCAPPPK